MNPDYDEWKKKVDAGKAERAAEHRPQLEMLAQAEVKAGLLTGDQNFDIFLSYLQAALEVTEAQRDGFAAVIADPATVAHDRIMAAKICLAECKGRAEAFEAVISLPKDIMEMGAEAKTLLERMPATAGAQS